MSQITLRKIPEPLDKQLRNLADKRETSLNKVIIALLSDCLGISTDSGKKRDLSDLCGTWSRDEYNNFKKNTEIFERIDRDIWNE